jgi:hypothetical protein
MGARGITRSSLGETTAKGKIPNSICHSFLNLTIAFFWKKEEGLFVCYPTVCVCLRSRKRQLFSLSPSSDLFSQKYKCVCLTAFPQLWAMWPEVICPLGGKRRKEKQQGKIWLYSGGGLFRASFTDRQHTVTHTRKKKTTVGT